MLKLGRFYVSLRKSSGFSLLPSLLVDLFPYLMCSHFGTKCVYATAIRALSSDSVIFVAQQPQLQPQQPRRPLAVRGNCDQTTIFNMKRAFKVHPTNRSQDKPRLGCKKESR